MILVFFLLLSIPLQASLNPVPLPALNSEKAVYLRFAGQVMVQHGVIELGRVSELVCKRASDCENLQKLEISQMPADKDQVFVPASYVQQRVIETLGEGRSVEFDLPKVIEFRKQYRTFTRIMLISEIKRLISEKYGSEVDVDIKSVQFPESIAYSFEEKIEIELASSSSDISKDILLRLKRVNSQNGKSSGQFVRATVRLFAYRWVIRKDLERQSRLDADDFEWSRIDISQEKRKNPVLLKTKDEFKRLISGAHLTRSLSKGATLYADQFEKDPDVLRGQKIRIVLMGGSGLKITASGEALKDAAIGTSLKAKLDKTHRIVSGELVDKGVMEIGL